MVAATLYTSALAFQSSNTALKCRLSWTGPYRLPALVARVGSLGAYDQDPGGAHPPFRVAFLDACLRDNSTLIVRNMSRL